MKFLHIMSADVGGTYQTIKFMTENFDKNDHGFLVVATREYVILNNPILLSFPQLIYIEDLKPGKISSLKRYKFYSRLFHNAQYIVWHSYYPMKGRVLPAVALKKAVLHKTVWIEYGLDLFRYQDEKRGWKNRIPWMFRTRIRSIGTTIESDEAAYADIYKNDKEMFLTPLPIAASHVDLLKRNSNFNFAHPTPIVLLGYDRFISSRQLEILTLLRDFDMDRFKVLLPYTFYMNWERSRFISSYTLNQLKVACTKTLQGKIPIICRANVPEETYFKILATVDIAVFDGQRPLNMNMLLFLLYLNKKVFLPSDSYLYGFLIKQGVRIYDTKAIPKMGIDLFLEFETLKNNENTWVKNHLDLNFIKNCWETLFQTLT